MTNDYDALYEDIHRMKETCREAGIPLEAVELSARAAGRMPYVLSEAGMDDTACEVIVEGVRVHWPALAHAG